MRGEKDVEDEGYQAYRESKDYVREKGQVIDITGNKTFYFEMKKYEENINQLKYI